MTAYYNENDPFCAQWLRNLIAAGLIAPGEVDDRSIAAVQPSDLRGFTQCHFFAGIAAWSHALRCAGWSDEWPIWTGSCPCQPFSVAGSQRGTSDERHLWPEFFRLIRECRPEYVCGEQVASPEARRWLDGQNAHLQGMRDREAVFGVLRELQGQSPLNMLGVCATTVAIEQANSPRSREEKLRRLAFIPSRERACGGCEVSGEEAWSSLRTRPEGYPATDRRRGVRADWNSILPYRAEILECAIPGQDRLSQGIHAREHASRSLCLERHGQHLGRGEDSGDCGSDCAEEEAREFASFIRSCGEPEETAFQHWERSVRDDLESAGYTCGAINTCACSVGAPHIRQRLYWLGVADGAGREWSGQAQSTRRECDPVAPGAVEAFRMADSRRSLGRAEQLDEQGQGLRREPGPDHGAGPGERGGPCGLADPTPGGQRVDGRSPRDAGHAPQREPACGMADADGGKPSDGDLQRGWGQLQQPQDMHPGFWADAIWLPCSDGKARPTKPGLPPLATGVAGRVGKLRAIGNSLCAPVAQEFIEALMECCP